MAPLTKPRIDTAMQPLRLLVLQPTPFCNIDCSYCYLSNRKSTEAMSLETLALACRCVFETSRLGHRLEVAWHGGEPLVVSLGWYEKAITLMEKLRPAALRLQHRFQTNGLLLNEAWAGFLARTGASIGLSIDGPADLHDANRRNRHGRGTHDAAMRAVRLLQDHHLEFYVITVLTDRTLDHPERLFDFYVRNGIKNVGFNIEEIEGLHRSSSLSGHAAEMRYRRFMRRFFDLVWDAPGLLKVRELETSLGHLLCDEAVNDEQNLPFAILSISHNGTISTFSPELAGAHHRRLGALRLGNVATHRLADIEHTAVFREIYSEIRRGIDACERSCPYFRWCGGGVPANKLFEKGRFDVTETMHCRLTRQVILDEVLSCLETRIARPQMQRNFDRARSSNAARAPR